MSLDGVVQKQNRCEDHDRAVPASVQRDPTTLESRAANPGRVQTEIIINQLPGTGHFLSHQWTEECRQVTITINTDVGPGTFSDTFAPSGVAIVAETGPAGPKGAAIPNASGISSYALQSDGTLEPISASVPTEGTANCWSVVTADGRYVYTSNSGSSSIAGFKISAAGALIPIGSTIVATLRSGATNIDIASSANSKYVYTLNAGNGTIGEFEVDASTGQLTALGSVGGLLPASGLNGIAAN